MKYLNLKRVASSVPDLKVGDTKYNVEKIIDAVREARENNVQIIVFPELCITGYTCADLFCQTALLNGVIEALGKILSFSEKEIKSDMIISVGLPLNVDNKLFNCAVMIFNGRILGVVPKTYIPNYNEFYEARWFSSGVDRISSEITILNQKVPFSDKLLFKDTNSETCIGIEICEDLWAPISPSAIHSTHGANIILNLSASNEVISKKEYRRDLVKMQSAKNICAYIYSSAGQNESTTDIVFSGHSIIAENGSIMEEEIFHDETNIIYTDIDIEKLLNDRRKMTSFKPHKIEDTYKTVEFDLQEQDINKMKRDINIHPFVPANQNDRMERCNDILKIQVTGLYQRMKKSGINKLVLGISGGLDSTLALLASVRALKELNLPMSNVIGISMPGFGTSNRTLNNAVKLMGEFGIESKEISIEKACIQHFNDINHNFEVHDITYENTQARERTKILMDVANQIKGLVIGTGDLSELALGWCTYNGDHMSMYSVNSSIPKTLVKHLILTYADNEENENIKKVLYDICDTPISPELLPPDEDGNITQKTESVIGSYELHDFFLYNVIRNCYSPKKVFWLAKTGFKGLYTEEQILETLKTFYKRFFSQQFKRSCMPDGPKVGSVSLSPRGDWRMPSDASVSLWLEELNQI